MEESRGKPARGMAKRKQNKGPVRRGEEEGDTRLNVLHSQLVGGESKAPLDMF